MKPKQIKTPYKLFVWNEYNPDYHYGLAFAIAENEEDAKKQIEEKSEYTGKNWGPVKVYELNEKTAFAVSGGC